MQAKNFGTELEENPAVEKSYNSADGSLSNLSAALPKDGADAYCYVYAFGNDDGSFDWKILNASATEKVKSLKDKEFAALEFTDDMILAEGTIPAEDTGYKKATQNKLACYANVYKNGALYGQWDYVGTYHEAELLED